MANPRDFLLNTDYEMDKIVLVKTGSFTTTTEFNHNLSFMPLVFGVWSTDSNFNSVNTLGELDSSTEVGYSPILSVECVANSSTVKLTSAGNTNNATLYYRVYAFEPSDSSNSVPSTNTDAKEFILNTDYNYRKLMKAGVFTQAQEEFSHNLGYIPQVLAWVQWGNFGGQEVRIQPLVFSSNQTNFNLTVTSTKIKLGDTLIPGLIQKVYWRIYYDEA